MKPPDWKVCDACGRKVYPDDDDPRLLAQHDRSPGTLCKGRYSREDARLVSEVFHEMFGAHIPLDVDPDRKGPDRRLLGVDLESRAPDGTEKWVVGIGYADEPPEGEDDGEVYSESFPTRAEAVKAVPRILAECRAGMHDPRRTH